MKTVIHLRDLAAIETPAHANYTMAQLTLGRIALEARDLRYNNRTGVIRDNRGELERLSNPADHSPLTDVNDVFYFHFARYVNNAASRLARGYQP